MQEFLPLTPRYPGGAQSHAYYEDFLTNQEIDTLLSHKSWLNSTSAEIGTSGTQGVVDPNIRKSNCAWLGCDSTTEFFWQKISRVIAEVNRQYFHYDLTGLYEPAQLTTYAGSGQEHYSCHSDCGPNSNSVPRKLSMSLLLSDTREFKGGELQLFTDSLTPITLEQKRGRAWFFPSYTLHQVTPVISGVRKSIVLWIGGPAFK